MTLRSNLKTTLKDANNQATPSYLSLHTIKSNKIASSSSSILKKPKITTNISSLKSAKTLVNYNKMYAVDAPPAYKIDSRTNILPFIPYTPRENNNTNNDGIAVDNSMSMNSGFKMNAYHENRLSGGTQRHKVDKIILSPSECKLQPAGLKYFNPKQQVNVINLQLNDKEMKANIDDVDCSLMRLLPTQQKQKHQYIKSKTRATQTLYRESSAQTLPYLPVVSNNPAELEKLEIFKLPTILPGDGPPGLYEVEVLERARKRWAFADALKENFRKQLEEAREQAKLQKHQHILEAFEWEHWIEREEYIQECQMLRLELLIRMFDKREREMHTASQKRIQKSCEMIEANRQNALKKNEMEHNRALRRLEIKHHKQLRVWRKEHISQGLGDPTSEFYAPKMRYGVNPNRRHFTALRKGFDMRMDDLEKRAVKMDVKHLKCPFAKLKEWSKPKQVLQEVEQNFCSDENLKKLYESLRTLRESSQKHKHAPQCLKAKALKKPAAVQENMEKVISSKQIIQVHIQDEDKISKGSEEADHAQYLEELRQQKQAERQKIEMLQKEMRCEELETLISSYEGNTIGWLMRFLSEEMQRLKEQRKLHFYTMLAKRERWRREAAEAGLRQKENCMRANYEKLYEECNEANEEITKKFLKPIFEADVKDYAEQQAVEYVTLIAKELDKEISGWLNSFQEVQNPLNYYTLRQALKDIVMPDIENILYRLERDKCIGYVINTIMCRVYKGLEAYDVSFSIANDFVDRLLDTDLYLYSPECSSECECTNFCCCSLSKREAMAIIRKAIRYAVPGRRWRTENERIAFENVRDLLNDVFEAAIPKGPFIEVDMKHSPEVITQPAHTDLVCSAHDIVLDDTLDDQISVGPSKHVKIKCLDCTPFSPPMDVTKTLDGGELLLLMDPDKLSADKFLICMDEYVKPVPYPQPRIVRQIPSTHDINSVCEFKKIPIYAQTSSEERLQRMMEEPEEEEAETENEVWEEENANYEEIIEEEWQELLKNKEELTEEISAEDLEMEHEPVALTKKRESRKSLEKTTHFDTKTEQEIIVIEPAPEENNDTDDEGGVMKVSFSYDPTVKYSVAVPSGNDITTNTKDEEVIAVEPTPEQNNDTDDDSAVMRASFSYNPIVKFSVPVPSTHDIHKSAD